MQQFLVEDAVLSRNLDSWYGHSVKDKEEIDHMQRATVCCSLIRRLVGSEDIYVH